MRHRLTQDAKVRAAVRHWGADRAAESRYVLDISQILGAAHKAAMTVVEREHLSKLQEDDSREDAPIAIGLGPNFRKKLLTWQKPRVDDAFARLAASTKKKTSAAAQVYGIHKAKVPGLAAAIETARAANVKLITNATNDFLDQVQQTLEDHEGETADTIRDALQDRVGVSKSRGLLIARDQSLKLNSQMVQHRARAAGAMTYTWSTSLDERVRPMHAELEGRVIHWDDPPETNDDGDLNHAGEDYQCRCTPAVIIDDDDEEESEDEPESTAAEE